MTPCSTCRQIPDPEIAALKRVMASVDRASRHQNQKDTEGFGLLHEAANTGEMEVRVAIRMKYYRLFGGSV